MQIAVARPSTRLYAAFISFALCCGLLRLPGRGLFDCSLLDTECLTRAAKDAAAHVQIGDCNLTDTVCITAESQAANERARVAAQNLALVNDWVVALVSEVVQRDFNATVSELESMLGCELADRACLRAKAGAASREAGTKAVAILHTARSRFEETIGCSVSDQACLHRRAQELSVELSTAEAELHEKASNASSQASEAARESAQTIVAALGCGDENSDVEGCLLRRGQELAVALSIVASTVVLAGAG